jgi:porphobilinogen synthase
MIRMRKFRRNNLTRELFTEVSITKNQLVMPIFIVEKINWSKEISSMPNIYQYSPDLAVKHVEELTDLGISNFILFGIPNHKDQSGSEAYNNKGVIPNAIKLIKETFDDKLTLFADVCLCEYTNHGHCGIPNETGQIVNDKSLNYLAKAALVYAEAGADWVAPSNMMDGRVITIKRVLDDANFTDVGILSYSAKFASNYYGPFRDAAESPPQFGDRKSYQIDYRTKRQALLEVESDIQQGADAVMVKPALPYLDIISKVRELTDLPLFAYNVSGEYSMVKFGAKAGLFDERAMVIENLIAIRRAGADVILTYHTSDIVKNGWLYQE